MKTENITFNYQGRPLKWKFDFDSILDFIKIDNEYTLYRDVNCDTPTEQWFLIKEYTAVKNSVPYIYRHRITVYHGKSIESESFMQELINHVLELTL